MGGAKEEDVVEGLGENVYSKKWRGGLCSSVSGMNFQYIS